jgi:predicted GNAT family N-acyltransferase
VLDEYKIAGYLQYSFYDEDPNKVHIAYVEVNPEFRGLKLCSKLIELLITKLYQELPNVKVFTLNNAGGLLGYKCYVSTFRKHGFLASAKQKNISFYNSFVRNNNNILSKNKTIKISNLNLI